MVLLGRIVNSAKRVPMIKFRKGGFPEAAASAGGSHQTSAPANTRAASQQAIESWQLPPRYQRRPIDQVECDYINRGGPE